MAALQKTQVNGVDDPGDFDGLKEYAKAMEEQYESNESPELIKKRAHASDESIFVDRDLEKRKMIEAEV